VASAGPDAAKRSGPTPAAPPAKSHVRITCAGPFLYDLTHDHATIDEDPAYPMKQVEVIRENKTASAQQAGLNDVLDCDHLELQFSRKKPPPGTTPAQQQDDRGGLTIETAHATARKELVLVSDAEMLEAYGTDLTYDTRNVRAGSLFFCVAGARAEGDALSFPVTGMDGGSISMLSVRFG